MDESRARRIPQLPKISSPFVSFSHLFRGPLCFVLCRQNIKVFTRALIPAKTRMCREDPVIWFDSTPTPFFRGAMTGSAAMHVVGVWVG